MTARVDTARRALWHLRTGGVTQVRTWAQRRRIERLRTQDPYTNKDGSLTFTPWPLPDRPPSRPDLRVAVILDDFSRLAFRYEWQQVEIRPETWRETLEAEPDLLFVESAWAGNEGAWRYHLTGPTAPRLAVTELLTWCNARGIPTVFWNKEDPTHFGDFLETARLFDHVLTTDARRVPAYVEALGHDRVGVLPFAAQPAIHNPVRPVRGHQSRDIAFAGMYFAHRHPERRAQMELLLGAAMQAGARMDNGLEIFSRQLGGDERYQFPSPYAERVVGSLSYPQMLSATKAYKVFLNVNTVTDSPTMCARRIFETTAGGATVVSAPSEAIGAVFDPFVVPQVSTDEEAVSVLRALVRSPELRDRMVHLAQRTIWSGHTYGHRVDRVLDAAGLSAARTTRPTVSALVSTNRPHQLDHVLATVGAQVGLDVQLVLLAHGFDLPPDVAARAADAGVGQLVTLAADADVPLGECLNRLVAAADGDLVAKMDDDDLYGPQYLSDQAYAMTYSGADVVGKHAHYLRLAGVGATLLRFADREHLFTDIVMGPTIVTRRRTALDVPFAPVGTGEDTGFLRDVVEAGGSVYAADRFNFIQVRQGDAAGEHTWDVSDAALLASGDVVAFADLAPHVIF